jgi:hypothetical protein
MREREMEAEKKQSSELYSTVTLGGEAKSRSFVFARGRIRNSDGIPCLVREFRDGGK